MAHSPEKPQGEFLGGSMKFNTVGGPVQPNADPAADPAADDTGPIAIPTRFTPHGLRTLAIVVVVLLLAGVLYFVNDSGLGGVVHTTGRGGISPAEKPSEPPKNF